MKIYTDAPEGATVVQNTFIDRYMPHANGEFVKVYLYLLRCANSGQELSLSSIADIFDHTEKDISRALAYWEKQQLLKMKLSPGGALLSVTFTTPPPEESVTTSWNVHRNSDPQITNDSISSQVQSLKTDFAQTDNTPDIPSRDRIAVLSGQKEIRQLFFIAEQYLQRPLTSAEQSDLVYYFDTLKFSPDLIEYLLEYCISKGSPSRHYMRKVALGWAEAGISTVLQAKQETNLHNKNYFTVLNIFGIKGRGPAIPEQEIMSRWFNDLGISVDLVLEACKRTIRQTHQPSFEYADSILEKWHQSGVTSLADVARLDQQRKTEQKKNPAKQPKPAANRFNNFSQRDYDYNQLEKQLLNQ